MPTTTIAKCRPFVQERKEFTASTLHAKWEEAEDGTKLYVVRSISRRNGYILDNVILFAHHDGQWYDGDLTWGQLRRRREQKFACRPSDKVARIPLWELRAFVAQGMCHHPKMSKLLAVSV
jgi:hypothetical protein